MDILRPPPGRQDDEAPPPPRNRFLQFVFAVLFLVIGMVVFFVGGLVVRNPELPNYLLDQIVRRFQGETRSSATTGKAYVSSAENLKPPAPPTTAEQCLNLMSYDENSLPPDERAIASVLNQTVNGLVGIRGSPRLAQLFNDQIMAGLKNLQPGSDVTSIRSAVAECHETANAAIKFYQELPEQLAAKLMAAGVTGSLAHRTAEIFAERAQAKQTISYAANVNLVCKNVTTMVDLLSKGSTKWKRNSDGGVQFTSKAPFEQYNAAAIELNSAVKALNGG